MRMLLTVMLAGLLAGVPAQAAESPIYTTGHGAIRGYDPVAYFTVGQPMKGTPHITHEWRGATWHFTSVENRDRFAADPERYAPAYGGYCAYAVAHGATARTVPEAFEIVDGRLYLNYSEDVQRRWDADQAGFIRRADANWPGVLD